MARNGKMVDILQRHGDARLDFLPSLDCILRREKIQAPQLISRAILSPKAPGATVRHALDGRDVIVVGKRLGGHVFLLMESLGDCLLGYLAFWELCSKKSQKLRCATQAC